MQVCTSLQTDNHARNPPLSFLQAGCPSCRPTNSVKAPKGETCMEKHRNTDFDNRTVLVRSPPPRPLYISQVALSHELLAYSTYRAVQRLSSSTLSSWGVQVRQLVHTRTQIHTHAFVPVLTVLWSRPAVTRPRLRPQNFHLQRYDRGLED